MDYVGIRDKVWIDHAHRILFSLNIAYSMTYAVVAFTYSSNLIGRSARYFLLPGEIFFLRYAAKINSLLVLDRGNDVGRELMAVACILVTATLSMLILYTIRDPSVIHLILYPVAGMTALALLPVLLLYVLRAKWMPNDFYPFWKSFDLSITLLKISLVLGFFYLTRRGEISIWWSAFVLLTYYSLWILLPWSVPLWSLRLFFVVFPLSGFAWLLYAQQDRVRKVQ
jgi:hypothetical protein